MQMDGNTTQVDCLTIVKQEQLIMELFLLGLILKVGK